MPPRFSAFSRVALSPNVHRTQGSTRRRLRVPKVRPFHRLGRSTRRGTYAATTVYVVVTGSSGPIGQALCSHLADSGHHVVRVVRRPVRPGEIALAWNPEAGTLDADGLEGADAVVHLAGAGVGDGRWTESRKRVLVESRTRSTALLAAALAGLHQPPRVLVSASAIGFYGDRNDELLTEQSPPGHDFLASLCVRWEAETAPAAEAGLRVVCARTGLVLSKGGGALAQALAAVQARPGRAVRIG